MRWRSRPVLATLLRLVAVGLPIAVSATAVFALTSVVPPPRGSLGLYACWWAGLSVAATVVLVAAGRVSRRLLPLAALMRLSLVFPDGAPSRIALARRSGTVATLEQRLAEARRGDAGRTPIGAAQRLLVLVAHLDEHDSLTRGHSERVRQYAQSIGRELGLGRRELDLLNWAALLHDVGKLDVPHEILTKEGRPTDDEWQVLRSHPSAGAQLAAPLRDWLGEWGAAIEEHHERWDGAGYPQGLAGTDISLGGRIVAVADVYDVLTSSRSYKQAGSPAAAREELARCAGTQFDPTVVRAFLAMSVRSRRLVVGPLAWLAHAPVLARIPLTPAAGVVSAAALATGAPLVMAEGPAGQLEAPAVSAAEPTLHVSVTATDSSRPTPARAQRPAGVATEARDGDQRPTTVSRQSEPVPVASVDESPAPPADPPTTAAPATPESATPGTSTPAPALEPSAQPARPVPEPTAPQVDKTPPRPGEIVKPVADAVRPVTEIVEPVVDSVVVIASPVTQTTQPVVDALQPVTQAAQPVVGAAQPATEAVSALPVVGPVVQLLPILPGAKPKP